VLLDVDSVDHEAVGGFALAVDGEVAGVCVAGGIDATGDASHDDGAGQESGDRGDAGLDGEEVSVAAAVERDGGHLIAGDYFAEVGCGGVDLNARLAGDGYDVGAGADFERGVDAEGGVGVYGQVDFSLGVEACRGDVQLVTAYGKIWEGVEALLVGDCVVGCLLGGVDEFESRSYDNGATLVSDRAGDAAAGGGLHEGCDYNEVCERQKRQKRFDGKRA